ncbi:hypothetical protein BMF94_3862 [Rhodotorula taiwanensis]|uniref:Uncharacterized protein n=1 Tax=Rhodotorula taiwanensis TaxID=741276 RepID=A0A2S5B8B9_9BASI|nr:hypothetical protein BMF94_3862 [Rhodotorula taiwanensis]
MFGRILVALSSLALLHSVYAAWSARTTAKYAGIALERRLGTQVPTEVAVEAIASFVLLVIGILWTAPPLKGVTFASEMSNRTVDTADAGLGLANLRHRGAILFAPEPVKTA